MHMGDVSILFISACMVDSLYYLAGNLHTETWIKRGPNKPFGSEKKLMIYSSGDGWRIHHLKR